MAEQHKQFFTLFVQVTVDISEIVSNYSCTLGRQSYSYSIVSWWNNQNSLKISRYEGSNGLEWHHMNQNDVFEKVRFS